MTLGVQMKMIMVIHIKKKKGKKENSSSKSAVAKWSFGKMHILVTVEILFLTTLQFQLY